MLESLPRRHTAVLLVALLVVLALVGRRVAAHGAARGPCQHQRGEHDPHDVLSTSIH